MHLTIMKFRKALGIKSGSTPNYFDPQNHKDKFSDDALGNMQPWFVILTELYMALCEISGDELENKTENWS